MIADNAIGFGQSVFDTPAPEETQAVSLEPTIANQRPLRTGSRMYAKIRVIVAMTVFDFDVVTDLKADPVAVVVASLDSPQRVSVAVLQEDTAAVVAIEVLGIRTIAIERDVLDGDVRGTFTRQQRKQRRTGWIARKPKVLA